MIWGLDKGFDVTDGGCSVLRYQQAQPNLPCDYWYDHILVKAIVPKAFRSIIDLRYLGFVLNLLISLSFALAIRALYIRLHSGKPHPGILILCMTAGFIASYPGMPSDLSYNSLNQFFLIGAVSALIYYVAGTAKLGILSLFVSAVMTGFVYAVKLPSGMIFTVVALLVITLRAKGLSMSLYYLAFLILTIAALNIFIKPGFISHYLKTYSSVVSNESLHSFNLLYVESLRLAAQILLTCVLTLPVSVAFWLGNISSASWVKTLSRLFGIFCVALFLMRHLMLTIDGEPLSSQVLVAVIVFQIYSRILGCIGRRGSLSIAVKRYQNVLTYVPLMIVLFFLPYIGAFGSAVKWDIISKYYYITLTGLIWVLIPKEPSFKAKWGISLLILCTIFASIYVYVWHPFGQEALFLQTEPYHGVKIDPQRKEYLLRLERMLKDNSFDPEQGMIVAYTAPGIVYLMGSHHPGGILWKPKRQAGYFTNLSQSKLYYRPVVLSLHYHVLPEFITGFESATGFSFERDYKLVGEIPYPNGVSSSYIYFPMNKVIGLRGK